MVHQASGSGAHVRPVRGSHAHHEEGSDPQLPSRPGPAGRPLAAHPSPGLPDSLSPRVVCLRPGPVRGAGQTDGRATGHPVPRPPASYALGPAHPVGLEGGAGALPVRRHDAPQPGHLGAPRTRASTHGSPPRGLPEEASGGPDPRGAARHLRGRGSQALDPSAPSGTSGSKPAPGAPPERAQPGSPRLGGLAGLKAHAKRRHRAQVPFASGQAPNVPSRRLQDGQPPLSPTATTTSSPKPPDHLPQAPTCHPPAPRAHPPICVLRSKSPGA